MTREKKGNYKVVIKILIEGYQVAQESILQMTGWDAVEFEPNKNSRAKQKAKEIFFKNIISWTSELHNLQLYDQEFGLLETEILTLKEHTNRLDDYRKLIQGYRLTTSHDSGPSFSES